jgi:hypothetical protein
MGDAVNGGNRKDAEEQMRMRRLRIVRRVCREDAAEWVEVVMRSGAKADREMRGYSPIPLPADDVLE